MLADYLQPRVIASCEDCEFAPLCTNAGKNTVCETMKNKDVNPRAVNAVRMTKDALERKFKAAQQTQTATPAAPAQQAPVDPVNPNAVPVKMTMYPPSVKPQSNVSLLLLNIDKRTNKPDLTVGYYQESRNIWFVGAYGDESPFELWCGEPYLWRYLTEAI